MVISIPNPCSSGAMVQVPATTLYSLDPLLSKSDSEKGSRISEYAIPLDKLRKYGRITETLDIMEQRNISLSWNNARFLLLEGGRRKDIKYGLQLQASLLQSEVSSIVILTDHLVRLFASCGSLVETNHVCNRISGLSIYTWCSIISAHASLGQAYTGLELYSRMKEAGVQGNEFVYLSILKACMHTMALMQGRAVHAHIIQANIQSNIFVGSALVDMYSKCGSLMEAREVFNILEGRDVVCWGAMITGYARHGEGLLALDCYENMQYEDITPDRVIFSSVLKACGGIGMIYEGRRIHAQVIKCNKMHIVIGNALIDMYAKCGSLEETKKAFDNLSSCDLISWNSLIDGLAEHNESITSLECYSVMLNEGEEPDKITFLSTLKACGNVGTIHQGRQIHEQVIEKGLGFDCFVGSALVDMYSKCGSMEESGKAFYGVTTQNVVSWSAMIAGYAQLGNAMLTLLWFEGMQSDGIKPDDATFVSVLTACCHAGLVDEGRWVFELMRNCYGIKSNTLHLTCMIDLLGHEGRFSEAEELLRSFEHAVSGWVALLDACKMHGNKELGKRCFGKILRLDSCYAAGYVLISNMYADDYMGEDLRELDKLMHYVGFV